MAAINGFVIEIKNETNQKQLVQLFENVILPDGLKINSHRTEVDYQQLLSYAQLKGFIGSGINADEKLSFTICNGLTKEKYFTNFLAEKEILIDGFSNYIELEVPVIPSIIFQLMPTFKNVSK
jgi:hypothetical protein